LSAISTSAGSTGDDQYAVTGKFVTVNAGGREYRYFDGTRVVRK